MIDIFAESKAAYEQILSGLTTAQAAQISQASELEIKRFDLPDLNAIKLSLARPEVQGSLKDRDMHGASWAALLAEVVL